MADPKERCSSQPRAGELVPCSASLCPFATWVNASAPAKGSNGTSPGPRAGQLVNRAPYGINLHMAQVNANTAKDYQQGSFSAFAIFSKFDVSMTVRLRSLGQRRVVASCRAAASAMVLMHTPCAPIVAAAADANKRHAGPLPHVSL